MVLMTFTKPRMYLRNDPDTGWTLALWKWRVMFSMRAGRKDCVNSEDALRRYRWAVDELDRWCGHESPHARLIAAHIRAVGEGEAKNAGAPCGMEVCDIQGTRQQLRRIDQERSAELDGLEELMADTEWLKAELSTRVAK